MDVTDIMKASATGESYNCNCIILVNSRVYGWPPVSSEHKHNGHLNQSLFKFSVNNLVAIVNRGKNFL